MFILVREKEDGMNGLKERSRNEGARTALLHFVFFIGATAFIGGFIAYVLAPSGITRIVMSVVIVAGAITAAGSRIAMSMFD